MGRYNTHDYTCKGCKSMFLSLALFGHARYLLTLKIRGLFAKQFDSTITATGNLLKIPSNWSQCLALPGASSLICRHIPLGQSVIQAGSHAWRQDICWCSYTSQLQPLGSPYQVCVESIGIPLSPICGPSNATPIHTTQFGPSLPRSLRFPLINTFFCSRCLQQQSVIKIWSWAVPSPAKLDKTEVIT